MNDLAAIWPTLNNEQKQNTAVTLAGRYQLSRFLALMNNYQMGLDATATAQNSYNSAVEENEKFMVSLAAKLNLVKSSFQNVAKTLGEAGMYKAISLFLEGSNNMLQGITKIIDVLGKWTFVIPAAVASVSAFAIAFQRSKTEALTFQMAMLGMNTNMSRMAFTMSASVTTSGLLATAFGTLRTAALGLTAALLTNPLTWITVALTAIPMVIGHFQRLKAEQEALAVKAEDNNKAFKEFKAELAAETVNQTSLDVFNSKAEVADKLLDKLKKSNEDYKKSTESLAAAQGNISSQYGIANAQMGQYNNWQDKLSKKTKEELADIGIKYEKYNSFQDLMKAVTKKQVDYTTAVESGQGILKEAEKQLMFNADAFDAVGEEVEETMTLMQNFFGVNEQMIQEMVGSYNAIQVLNQVQNKNQAQTEALNQALDVFVAKTGLSREELLKNPAAMQEVINYHQKMEEKWGEATDKVLTAEQAKQLAVDVTTTNVRDGAAEQTAAERVAAEEKALAAQEEAKKKAEAFQDVREEMILTKALYGEWTESDKKKALERAGVIDSTSKENIGAFNSESLKAQSTQKAHETLANTTGTSSTKRQTAIDKAASTAFSKLGQEQSKLAETGSSWQDMSSKASSANSTVASTTSSTSATTSGKLSTLITKIRDAKLGWSDLRDVFRNPISGTVSIIQKVFGSKTEGKGGGTANIRPLGMGGPITSGYGYRRDPFTGTKAFHHGVDTAGMLGESIRSRVSGKVVYSGYGASGTPLAGLGNVVAIQDGVGRTHIYGHNQNNYARVGQMVQAGQSIGSMGSTGRSTGTHSHYEVRVGGRSINPMGGTYKVKAGDTFSEIAQKYYGNAYNGGMTNLKKLNPSIKNINSLYVGQSIKVPDSGSKSSSSSSKSKAAAAKKAKEIAAAIAKRKKLEKEAAQGTWSKNTGTIDYKEDVGIYSSASVLSSLISNRKYASVAGGSEQRDYNKRVLESLSSYTDPTKLKKKFNEAQLFGSAAERSKMLEKLLKDMSARTKEQEKEKAKNKWSGALGNLSYRNEVGLYDNNTSFKTLTTQRGNAAKAGLDEQREYNKQIIDNLSELTDVATATTKFHNANLFGSSADKAKMLNGILIQVRENIANNLQDSTETWLENFTNGLTKANEKIQDMINLNNSLKAEREAMAKNNFVDNYVDTGMRKFSFEEPQTKEEKLQERMDAIKKEAETRLNQNAEISWYSDPSEVTKRKAQLQKEMTSIASKISSTEATIKKNGLNKEQSTAILIPLQEEFEALKKELTDMNAAVSSNSSIYKENQTTISKLGSEYQKLQEELNKTQKQTEMLSMMKDKISSLFNWNSSDLWTEKTDEFGNTVRDIEGAVRNVLDVQKAIQDITSNIYENIDATVEEMITNILTSELPDIGDLFGAKSDYSGIATGINGAIDTIKPTWDEALAYMSSSMMNMFSGQNWESTMASWIDNMSMVTDGLEPLFENMMMKFPEVIGNIMSELPNLVSTAMRNTTVGVFNTVVEVLNRLVATVNQIVPEDLRVPMFDQMQYATPTYTQNNESKTEQKVYQTGNVERNVTYVINTGVAIASESELREFAMLLKGMMDEEEGRGN